MSVAENISSLRSQLTEDVTLVAVSKTKPVSLIREAYAAGQRVFGENRALEMAEKHAQLPEDIEWHMIGHMQTNKVRNIAPFVSLIHSIDSLKLLQEVNKRASQNNRTIPVLLQFHIAQETNKFGFDLAEAIAMLESEPFAQMENVEVHGVMGMATFTHDENVVRAEFQKLKKCFGLLQSGIMSGNSQFRIVSMGMSGDYEIAIEEGSNMIRVGSSIFGSRA